MGCGHSKISIYPRRNRHKNSSKKSVTPEKAESEEEDGIETETDNSGNLEECEQKKTIKVKPFSGPLLAQAEISTSQQDFFKMLDEKIQNGPDYNSESDSERASESARLRALLWDWETASSGSRSLPATPKRRPAHQQQQQRHDAAVRPATSETQRDIIVTRTTNSANDRTYLTEIPPNVIHQSYGVHQVVGYRQSQSQYNNPNYISQSPSPAHHHQHHHQMAYPMQYQAISPMYGAQLQLYPAAAASAPLPVAQAQLQPQPQLRHHYPPSYGGVNAACKGYANSGSPKHAAYEAEGFSTTPMATHSVYGPKERPGVMGDMGYKSYYANGELLQQQHYGQQQQQYQQYKETREQQQQQQQQHHILQQQLQQQAVYRGLPTAQRNYQSKVATPVGQQLQQLPQQQQNEINSLLHRKQYELT